MQTHTTQTHNTNTQHKHTHKYTQHIQHTLGWYNRFARHPYPSRTGVNAGLLLLNLTRMREDDFLNTALAYQQVCIREFIYSSVNLYECLFRELYGMVLFFCIQKSLRYEYIK
jgi:hypothetical protein